MSYIGSYIESVSIKDVAEKLTEILASCFTCDEQADLAQGSVQTTAGLLAVKKSLVTMAKSEFGVERLEQDFALSHTNSGAPQLYNIQGVASFKIDDLSVSLCHTLHTAYGLVSLRRFGR